jgi:hypothetical protein
MSGSSARKSGQNIALNPNKLEDAEMSEAAIRMYGHKDDSKKATDEISTRGKSLGPKAGNETASKRSGSAKTRGKRTKKVTRQESILPSSC